MKTINLTFEDKQFKLLKEKKTNLGLNWEKFVLILLRINDRDFKE